MKKVFLISALLLVFAALVAVVWWQVRGVSHRDIYDAVVDNTKVVLDKVDDRADHLEDRFDKVEEKLEVLGDKLDKMLEIATRPLPDNLQEAH